MKNTNLNFLFLKAYLYKNLIPESVLKLHLHDFYDDDYELIAIHSSLEDFRLAYFINQKLPILLGKCADSIGLTTKNTEVFFSKFVFEDEANDARWYLFENMVEAVSAVENNLQDLFLDSKLEIEETFYLLPEFKKVDYFLKIENNHNIIDLQDIVKKLNAIERISAVYTVDPDKIKSKNNLIF